MSWRTMASSSDNSSPAAGRGFIPAQNDAERFLQKRTEELCRTALDKGIPRYTGFLSDREQLLAAAAAHRSGTECIRFWGGYEGAERAVFCVEPPDSWQEEPIATLRLRAETGQGGKYPEHRDYLGAILGLGLDRSCIGDLLQNPDDPAEVYAFVLDDKAEFLCMELTSAGRSPVRAERCDKIPLAVLKGPQRRCEQASVSSLRADAVLAAMLHTSRTKAAEYIAAGRVEVNHLPVRGAHELLYEKDLLTIRGAGRFRLTEIGGKTRKDRVFIIFFRY